MNQQAQRDNNRYKTIGECFRFPSSDANLRISNFGIMRPDTWCLLVGILKDNT